MIGPVVIISAGIGGATMAAARVPTGTRGLPTLAAVTEATVAVRAAHHTVQTKLA